MSHVLVVCARRYNGHELWVALDVLTTRGHSFEVISTDTIIQDEITYEPSRVLRTVDDVTLEELRGTNGLMIISGNMADTEAYWRNERVLSYVEWFNSQSLPIAAICCSVPTVRYAASGKRVSFFPLVRSRRLLGDAGAILEPVALTRDANLVTAEHQMATQIWTEEFCNLLEGKPPEYKLTDSGFTPGGRERKPIPEIERLKAQRRAREGGEK